jgi:hypothetical protein
MKGPVVMALAIFVALAALAQAQTPATNLPHEKVSFESAKATAEAKAPKGLLTSHELVHQLATDHWYGSHCLSNGLSYGPWPVAVPITFPGPTMLPKFYDVAGRRLARPPPSGVYFVRLGGETRKRLVLH